MSILCNGMYLNDSSNKPTLDFSLSYSTFVSSIIMLMP